MRRVRWLGCVPVVSGILTAYLIASGCGDCTDIGCEDAVIVQLDSNERNRDAVAMLQACANRTCRKSERISYGERPVASARLPLPDAAEAAVSVTLYDQRGRVVARANGRAPVVTNRPNGPDCPPECQRITVRLDGTRLVPAEA